MKEIVFLPPSDKELDDAIDYYNDQLSGLGSQFFQELMNAIEVIQKFPRYSFELIKGGWMPFM